MSGDTTLRIDPSKTALIIQDMQNDVLTDGGAWADSGAPLHAKSQDIVANVASLAAEARRQGMPVIHVHYIVEPGAPGLKLNAPLFQGVKEVNALVRGTWGAAPVDGLEPLEGDFVIEKLRMNGFFGTKLEILLHGLEVDSVIITGAWTNMSIEHSARHAADAGFWVFVATDGTSTVNDDWQKASLEYALTNVAQMASCADMVEALRH
jgi:gluconolactonase